MHAYSGSSHLISLLEEVWLETHGSLSLCMHPYVQQLYAPAGHGVQNGVQPACPRKPSRVHHRRQCVFSFPFPLYMLLSGRCEGCLFTRWLTRSSHSRGPGTHTRIRQAPLCCLVPSYPSVPTPS